MRKMKIIFGVLLITAAGLYSCEKTDNTYKGPVMVEFAPLTTSSTYTSAFTLTIKQANYMSMLDTVELTINLVGPQQNKDINLEYTLLTEKVNDFPSATYFIDPTTAIEGTHFNFLPARTGSTNGIITFPAHSSFGKIKLNTLAAQVAPDVSKRVVIKLVSTNEIQVNPNFQYFIVVITRL